MAQRKIDEKINKEQKDPGFVPGKQGDQMTL
jgi:hypothetical protein